MKRFLALVLSFAILLSALPVGAFAASVTVSGDDGATKINVDNALHFIVRHWHAVSDPSSSANSGRVSNAYLLDGYIVPNRNGADPAFRFYIRNSEEDATPYEELTDPDQQPGYISELNSEKGIITFSTNPYVASNGDAVEEFSGYSISAGHNAVTSTDTDDLQIAYDAKVHLAKTHVFYITTGLVVDGSSEEKVLGFDNDSEPEIDTAQGYICTTSFDNYTAGDLISTETYDKLPESQQANFIPTKIYSTTEGLHTDKTASVNKTYNDGRTFDLDLEAWYLGDHELDIALVLDASGSMAFTAEKPTPINIDDLDLSDDMRDKLKAKKLNSTDAITSNADWGKKFLSIEETNAVLNPRNTDFSPLGSSGYSYFVYNPRDSVLEFAPLAFWDATIPKASALLGYYSFKGGNDIYPRQNTSDGYPFNARAWLYDEITGSFAKALTALSLPANDEAIGFILDATASDNWDENDNMKAFKGLSDNSGWDIAHQDSTKGFVLNAQPSTANFALTFTVDNRSFKGSGPIEILYIGAIDGTPGDYCRIVYESGSLIVYQNNATAGGESLLNLSGLTTVTLVFQAAQDGTVTLTAYQGTSPSTGNSTSVNLSDGSRIAFGAIKDSYNGSEKLYIDEIYVFDDVLAQDEIKNFYSVINSTLSATTVKSADEDVLGTIISNYLNTPLNNVGWYYINPSGNWSENYANQDIQTSKVFCGLYYDENVTFKDEIPKGGKLDAGNDANTSSTYQPVKGAPTSIRFYIDENGYVRCFFMTGTSGSIGDDNTAYTAPWATSYVYDNSDGGYIKVEALQRALGNFVNMLYDVSPTSRVSATRFSTSKIEDDLDKLVLLDWTNDPAESSSILSLQRGEDDAQGTALGYTESAGGVKQYNYGLTGSTSTQQGLKAFEKYLLGGVNPKASKYLIIFTDGKDTDLTTSPDYDNPDNKVNYPEALKIVNALKQLDEEVYGDSFTVYTIMLTGGPVTKGSDDYEKAEEFLLHLSGTPDTVDNYKRNEREPYFHATLPQEGELSTSFERLLNIFTDTILKDITERLEKYEVQDYIDPRFDLVASDGTVYHLDKGGKVTPEYTSGGRGETKTITSDTGLKIHLSADGDITDSAHYANLYYDSTADMYYLKWVPGTTETDNSQMIPVGSADVSKVAIWHARVTVRAKEDFIGGNAVLTNGNAEKQNYVYRPGDINRSSGTDDSGRRFNPDDSFDYPSKGFPRVTVNVASPVVDGSQNTLIYMGETVPQAMLRTIIEKVVESDGQEKWYWEYLLRYVSNTGNQTLLDDFIANKTLELPYFYLPDLAGTNQTGSGKQEADQLGTLIYTWDTNFPSDNKPSMDTTQRAGSISVTYAPISPEDRIKGNYNKNVVVEANADGLIYAWNPGYKPAVGNETSGDSGEYSFTVDIVSGQIVLQVLLTRDDVQYLQQVLPADGSFTYKADLSREYDGKIMSLGTFIVDMSVDELANIPNGAILTAALEYSDDYETVSKDEKYALPIGTYTVTGYATSDTEQYTFTLPTAVDIAVADTRFTRYGDQIGEPANSLPSYTAPVDAQTVYLGTGTGKTYTDQRYELLQVRIEHGDYIPDVPQTGDDSRLELWLMLMLASAAVLCISAAARRRALGRR